MKTCSKCNIAKPITNFYRDNRTPEGYRTICKTCTNADNNSREGNYREYRKQYRKTAKYKAIKQQYYISNKELILANNRQWRTQTLSGRFHVYKKNAADREISWDLSISDFSKFWKLPCTYCGTNIETIGLDRVDSKHGYTLTNVVSCCTVCNMMKLDLTRDEFLCKVKEIARHLCLQFL